MYVSSISWLSVLASLLCHSVVLCNLNYCHSFSNILSQMCSEKYQPFSFWDALKLLFLTNASASSVSSGQCFQQSSVLNAFYFCFYFSFESLTTHMCFPHLKLCQYFRRILVIKIILAMVLEYYLYDIWFFGISWDLLCKSLTGVWQGSCISSKS